LKAIDLTAATRLFAILGDPVSQSRSPIIQNAAMRARALDAAYLALRCSSAEAVGLLIGLARAGGGGNVTIPHKGLAAATVDKPSARVRATHACNTFWSRRGNVYGENTDVIGFSVAVKSVVDDVQGTRALVLGAGGGARAVVYALLEAGCSGITILGRSKNRAKEMIHVAGRRARRVAFVTDEKTLRHEGYDLVVNATPLGLRPNDRLPLRLGRVAGLTAVLDIVYKPGDTAWVNYARSLGIPAAGGAEMLLQQAAAAFELWFDEPAPVNVMRKALGA
jgi:shikimate dehydrogenase